MITVFSRTCHSLHSSTMLYAFVISSKIRWNCLSQSIFFSLRFVSVKMWCIQKHPARKLAWCSISRGSYSSSTNDFKIFPYNLLRALFTVLISTVLAVVFAAFLWIGVIQPFFHFPGIFSPIFLIYTFCVVFNKYYQKMWKYFNFYWVLHLYCYTVYK